MYLRHGHGSRREIVRAVHGEALGELFGRRLTVVLNMTVFEIAIE
jgi:hypothetical protein